MGASGPLFPSSKARLPRWWPIPPVVRSCILAGSNSRDRDSAMFLSTRFLRWELPSRNYSACWAAQMDFLSVVRGLRSLQAGAFSSLEMGVCETQLPYTQLHESLDQGHRLTLVTLVNWYLPLQKQKNWVPLSSCTPCSLFQTAASPLRLASLPESHFQGLPLAALPIRAPTQTVEAWRMSEN